MSLPQPCRHCGTPLYNYNGACYNPECGKPDPASLITIISDDPSDGRSSGPPNGWRWEDLNVQCAAVWSGKWDSAIFDEIISNATARRIRTLLVLTQTAHHKAWVKAVAGLPLLDIRP